MRISWSSVPRRTPTLSGSCTTTTSVRSRSVHQAHTPGDESRAMTLPRAYEDQLVERAKTDADAFGELYDHYFGQIYRFAYSRTRDQDAAEEVTQEVFMKALRAMPRYRPSGHPFSSWLYQISANAIADHFRQRRPQASLDAAVEIVDPT